jgi:hypothetical protein
MVAAVVQLDDNVEASPTFSTIYPYLGLHLAVRQASVDLGQVLFDLGAFAIVDVDAGRSDPYEHATSIQDWLSIWRC